MAMAAGLRWLDEELRFRIRAEYREMPGLRLTVPQAARLWQVEPVRCAQALQSLARAGVLACVGEHFVLAEKRTDTWSGPVTLSPRPAARGVTSDGFQRRRA
ncbi:MAG: hypothetical protein ACT4QD_24170 [Acidobacteriota bacterium]